MKKALISVFDKTGIVEFAQALRSLGYEILSTGGTARTLKDAGIGVTDVDEYTKFPEMMGGRVKTMHPKILGGILCRRDNPKDMEEAQANGIEMIDIVVCNLYPFEETVKKGASFEDTIEMIDVGGPTMIRSAAKNFKHVTVITDPDDYAMVLEGLKGGEVGIKKRQWLAQKVFSRTAFYESEIMKYLANETFPDRLCLPLLKKQDMRYGENPHQQAAFYVEPEIIEPSVSTAKQLHGKALSYNNIMDADAAVEIVKEFKEPAIAVIKHANPAGTAIADTIEEALKQAYNADSLSAFGCVIASSRVFTKACAEFVSDKFVEVILAEGFDDDALDILTQKKNIRLLAIEGLVACQEGDCKHELYTTKKVVGGMLVQTREFPPMEAADIELVNIEKPTREEVRGILKDWRETKKIKLICPTKKQPTKEQLEDMLFGVRVCKHVKSNSVILVKDTQTVGMGAGQMSRVDSSMIAVRKAGEAAKGSVCVSDAFFPFRDGVDAVAKAGVTAIVQPGGSIRDQEVIDACDEYGIAMVFTGIRLFLH